jgi:hypothetical protein
MAVRLDDLELALLSVGGEYGGRAYVDLRTGEVHHASALLGEYDDELPPDLDDEARYVEVPDKRALGLGKPLALEFARLFLPDDLEAVREMFGRRGAYPRFKDLLARRGEIDRWHAFENDAVAEALRVWARDNDIPLTDPPAGDAAT